MPRAKRAPTRGAALLLGLVTTLGPQSAKAGNGSKERTPPVWPEGEACLLQVDRSVDPVVHFDYGVAADDLIPPDVTDEVDDSRTHQFFAMCRQADPLEPPPRWITAADVAAAEQKGWLLDGDGGPETILETNAQWSDCFVRITADDARVPITMAQAANGFDWDTSSVEAGNYVVYGYTWEPWANLWTGRPGIVQVHDANADTLPPAAAMLQPRDEQIVYRDSSIELSVCVSAQPGATYRIDYLVVPNGGGGSWENYTPPTALDTAQIDQAQIDFVFEPPSATWGEEVVYLRVVVADDQAREFAAVSWAPFNVQDADDPSCDEDTGGFIGNPNCGGEGEGESEGEESSGPSTSADGPGPATDVGAADAGASACTCTSTQPDGGRGARAFWAAFALLFWRRQSRVPRPTRGV